MLRSGLASLRRRLPDGSRALRIGAGATLGLAAAGGAQGLYLMRQYQPLPEAQGERRGVAAFVSDLKEKRSEAAAVAAAAAAKAAACVSQTQRRLSHGHGRASSPTPSERAPCRKNILFVGDSLVTGVGCRQDAGARGPALPRCVAEFLARALRVDVQWVAIGQTGADVAGLNLLLPAVGAEVRRAQDRGGQIDMVVVLCGLNDFKHAYTSLRRTAHGARSHHWGPRWGDVAVGRRQGGGRAAVGRR